MRGALILLAFFSLFTAASLLIPSPMFPGSVLIIVIGRVANEYKGFFSAVFNGIFYGALLWIVFIVISRRLEAEK